jgi:hypothetical protein
MHAQTHSLQARQTKLHALAPRKHATPSSPPPHPPPPQLSRPTHLRGGHFHPLVRNVKADDGVQPEAGGREVRHLPGVIPGVGPRAASLTLHRSGPRCVVRPHPCHSRSGAGARPRTTARAARTGPRTGAGG